LKRAARRVIAEGMAESVERHNAEIARNKLAWARKPLLRRIYRDFHGRIAEWLSGLPGGHVVELGSGVADIREVIPGCVRTDLFDNPWIDRVENVYALSFGDETVSDLILFDVFHHLRFPGDALAECRRALRPGGRCVLFEPCVSALGRLVYGALHPEPLGLGDRIAWRATAGRDPREVDYYAAQGNATRLFVRREIDIQAEGWRQVAAARLSALAYVASGGYSRRQLYPERAYPALRRLDAWLGRFPALFATRLLVVLEKPGGG